MATAGWNGKTHGSSTDDDEDAKKKRLEAIREAARKKEAEDKAKRDREAGAEREKREKERIAKEAADKAAAEKADAEKKAAAEKEVNDLKEALAQAEARVAELEGTDDDATRSLMRDMMETGTFTRRLTRSERWKLRGIESAVDRVRWAIIRLFPHAATADSRLAPVMNSLAYIESVLRMELSRVGGLDGKQ